MAQRLAWDAKFSAAVPDRGGVRENSVVSRR
jgi:hypothetical protein